MIHSGLCIYCCVPCQPWKPDNAESRSPLCIGFKLGKLMIFFK
jgi:hypothetical protein